MVGSFIPVSVLESDLHLAMKQAIIRDLVLDSWYKTEYSYGRSLRVDVMFYRKSRSYLVECETHPSFARLLEKGRRRNGLGRRTVYILVVPVEAYPGRDWGQLRGYFDQVYSYDPQRGALIRRLDLRTLGPPRDLALNALLPIYYSKRFKSITRWFRHRKNGLHWKLRELVQCTMCKLDLESPWVFCPIEDCPHSGSWYDTEP